MALEIVWQKDALQNFSHTLEYIELEFGTEASKVFLNKALSVIETLSNFPELGDLQVESKQIRGIVLSKQNSVFYRIDGS